MQFHHNDKTLAFIEVMSRITDADCDPSECLFSNNFLRPDTLFSTNKIELFVFDNDDKK